MSLQNIKTADAFHSTTNVKGRNEGDGFNDLVASIKEKGVLVPLLARAVDGRYEIIAGNRRLAAAKRAGLETIPVQLVKMNDIEAREAQIVENLQRADIHPLDEGELYRKLIEESKYDTASIAVKVGKSESYVKQRLFLTNLEEKPADAYRDGKIMDGHAALIAKLSPDDQGRAYKAIFGNWGDVKCVKDLADWIKENIYSPLKYQPWLKGKEAMDAVGECVECEPRRMSLFGDVREGACTSAKCWARKMGRFIAWRIKTDNLIRVTDDYGTAPKGVFSKNELVEVGKKNKCKLSQSAIIVTGASIGQTLTVCVDPKCPVHRSQKSEYGLSPKEVENRKTQRKLEIKKAKKEKVARQEKVAKALAAIRWPMSENKLDALYALALEAAGSNTIRSIAKRRALEIKKVKASYGGTYYDYMAAVKESVKGMEATEKIRMTFELLIDTGYDTLRDGIKMLIQ